MKKFLAPTLLFLIYLTIGIATITHYGINWDEPAHFMRGQAFLRFFLTGKKDYAGLPDIDGKSYKKDYGYEFVDKKAGTVIRRSIYQHNQREFEYYTQDIEKRGSHPAFSDVMSAVFNYIFFIRLGIGPDVFSYNYYVVFVAALLVAGTYYWVRKYFGKFAALISSISLALFPVFWAESHNNVKDIPQAVFFSFALFSLYDAMTTKKIKYMFLFALWGALAFSTKFNALFIIPIAVFWLVSRWLFFYRNKRIHPIPFFYKHRQFVISFLIIPLVIAVVWIGTFPAMWFESKLILASFSYYKSTGTTLSWNMNPFALYYLVFATPPIILFYSVLGLVGGAFVLKKQEKNLLLLISIWFFVTTLRVSMPHTVIYGGVRQIMEYIPALAVLSGVGAYCFVTGINQFIAKRKNKVFRNKFAKPLLLLQLVVFISFFPILLVLIKYHPNEGVYFNSFIGGLLGAKEHDIPDWGQTLGNPHRQGITWANKHLEKGAKLSLDFEYWSNLPHIWVRNDIAYDSIYKSGPARQGEYVMSITNKTEFTNWFRFKDLDVFLEPVYQVKVDDVALLKIWKNDKDHLKAEYKNIKEEKIINVPMERKELSFTLRLPKVRKILRIEFENESPKLCKDFNDYVGNIILYKNEAFSHPMAIRASAYDFNDKLNYREPFFQLAAEQAKIIVVNIAVDDPCYSTIKRADVIVIRE